MKKYCAKIDKLLLKEKLTYIVLWLFVFALPVIGTYYRTMDQADVSFEWEQVLRSWKDYVPFLLLFVVHDWFIAPLLVHENKKLTYLSIAGGALLLFAFYTWNQSPDRQGPPPREQMEMRLGEPGKMGIPPGRPDGNMGNPPPKPNGVPPIMIQEKLTSIFVAMLMIGVNLGIMLYFKQRRREEDQKELTRQKLQQELDYLKYQINPHFFMNTLNNIHALVDIDPEKAKSTIIELSKLMRYVLYESSRPTILLNKEIDFLQQYINLMRLRYTNRVNIQVDMPAEVPGIEVPPLLFIPFIENAFKHGVSYEHESFIRVKMQLQDSYLCFACENSKKPQEKATNTSNPHSGIGLENVQKRLKLIYGNDYFYLTSDNEKTYEVSLKIPVNHDTLPGNR